MYPFNEETKLKVSSMMYSKSIPGGFAFFGELMYEVHVCTILYTFQNMIIV